MFSALNLPDLDALDPAALKAMILAHHETYTATLSKRVIFPSGDMVVRGGRWWDG